MNLKTPLVLFLVFTGLNIGLLNAQENAIGDSKKNTENYYSDNYLRYDNHVYNKNIKTALLHLESDPLSFPNISLNSEQTLLLSFDDFETDLKTYVYTFIHCNANWEPSDLRDNDFINGFNINYLKDYEYSINTRQSYIHYWASFPNQNIAFTKSGNYIIKVYEDGKADKPVITKRFVIFENKVIVEAQVKRPVNVNYRNNKQQVDFKINYAGYNVLNPNEDLNVIILQNHRWDNAVKNIKPRFIAGTELFFDQFEENTFYGGNEFRHFDIKNLRFQTERIASIVKDSLNYVYLMADQSRATQRYSSSPDINGKFLVKNQLGYTSDYDADYVWINFKLNCTEIFTDGNLYVYGGLSNWIFSNDYKMAYDYDSKSYLTSIYLKQGYYNYNYVFLKDGSKSGDETVLEGSFFDTENDYTILVYHKEPGKNFQKLIGYTNINSRKTY